MSNTTVTNFSGNQLEKADAKLSQLFRRLVGHGYFSFSITGSVVRGGKRSVVISAGEEHKFTIPLEDIPTEFLQEDGS